MTTQEAEDKLYRKAYATMLRPIAIIQVAFILMMIVSPIVWIWFDWSKAWRVGLTGLVGTILVYGIYKSVDNIIKRVIKEEMKKR